MAAEPFRFVHAANLRLDEPLVGLGPIDSDLRRLAEDATLIAWNNVVEACVAPAVEFLLITGRLTPGDFTLRAHRALATGCASLAEYGIPVYWHGPGAGPLSEVRPRLESVDNLTVLGADAADPVRIVREGRAIASLRCVGRESPPLDQSRYSSPDVARIAVLSDAPDGSQAGHPHSDPAAVPATPLAELAASAQGGGLNFLAIGGGSAALSHAYEQGLLHYPGVPQGLCADETGPLGCSLIEVGASAVPTARPVAAAPVRWEQFRVGLEPGMTRAQLVEQMQLVLLDREPQVCERLWCVSWQLVGSGGLVEDLRAADDAGDALAAEVDAGIPSAARRLHRVAVRRRSAPPDDPLDREFLGHVDALAAEEFSHFLGELAPLSGNRTRACAQQLGARLDRHAVVETARRHGLEWLASGSGREV